MSKIKIILLIPLAALLIAAKGGQKIIDPSDMPFIPHSGPGAFDNALAQNTPYEPLKELRAAIEKQSGQSLGFFKGWAPEGEGHITVITPVEYWEVLRHFMTIEEVDAIALKNNIQKAKSKVLGIGEGRLVIDGKEEATYFIIVKSPALLNIRQAVYNEFVKRGGGKDDFAPKDFYPHITIGYTKRDLHIQDGVKKDMANSHNARLDGLLNQIKF